MERPVLKQTRCCAALAAMVTGMASAEESLSQNVALPAVTIDYSGDAGAIFHMQGVLAGSGLLLALAALVLFTAARRRKGTADDVLAGRVARLWAGIILLLMAAAAIPAIRIWTVLQG